MKRLVCFLVILTIGLSLGGCFLDPAESLYAVPKQSASFYNLQNAIEAVMGSSASYCPPVSGENQQPVQMADLDGDQEDEAIVFIKKGSDNLLCLCVFDKKDDSYSLLAKIEGVGNAFDEVQYVQFDGEGGDEIVVGRQLSGDVTQVLSVLTVQDGTLVELINTPYYKYTTVDLDSDGLRDVLLLHQEGDAENGVAIYYHWADGQAVRELEANLSAPVSAVKRRITGKMCQGVPAVFVASAYGEGKIVTDVFGLRHGRFVNLTLSEETDTQVQTVREYYVYSSDIDGDDLIELPRLLPMQAIEGDESSNNQSLISWYNILLNGQEKEKILTYHNYSDGWYLTIPKEWSENLAVRSFTAFGSARGYCFMDAKQGTTIFSIASVTKERANSTARQSGWTELTSKGEISYVCLLGEAASEYGLDIATLRRMFRLIQIDWNTGET